MTETPAPYNYEGKYPPPDAKLPMGAEFLADIGPFLLVDYRGSVWVWPKSGGGGERIAHEQHVLRLCVETIQKQQEQLHEVLNA